MNKNLNKFIAGAVAVLPMAVVSMAPVSAANVGLTVDNNGEYDSASSQEFTFDFTLNNQYFVGDTIEIRVFSPTETLGTDLADCSSATTTIDGGTGSFAFSTDTSTTEDTEVATFTFTGDSNVSPAATSLCLTFPAGAPQASYSVTLTGTRGDADSELVHVNDDNDVLVTAEVTLELSQNIRTVDDTADTNLCEIGLVDTSTQPNYDTTVDTGECGYGIAVGTNAASGFTTTITSDGDMTNGTNTLANIADGGTYTAGTEAFGIARAAAAQTGADGSGNFDQTITLGSAAGFDFSTNETTAATPVPATPTTLSTFTAGIDYESGVDATDLTLVINGVAVSAGTAAGLYSQTQTINTTATF